MFRKIVISLYAFKILKRFIPSFLRIISYFLNNQVTNIKNFKMNLFLKSSIEREIYLKGTYETEQINFASKILDKDTYDYFFDIGSYIGYYSLIFCQKVKKTIAFEPNKENFIRLKKNIELNNFNIDCHNIACSDKKKDLKIWYTDMNKKGGSSIYDEKDTEITKYDKSKIFFENIESIPLDHLFDLKDKIVFLKIDVERHELNVLLGASRLISNNKIFIQVEIFPHLKDKILHYLYERNFKLLNSINNDYYLKNF